MAMSNTHHRPQPQHTLHLLRRYFLCRADRVAFLAPWHKPSPAEAGDDLDAMLLTHLQGGEVPPAVVRYGNGQGEGASTGHFRIGSYSPAPDGTTKWLCADFDGGNHATALADPKAALLTAYHAFLEAGLPAHVEMSGGGRGWHLWVFFDPPLSAATARALGRALLPEEVTLATGEIVRTDTGRGIEIFPKQDRIAADGCGNLVWLPWWSEAAGSANQFHRVDEDGDLIPYVPTEFETADAARINEVLARRAPEMALRPQPACPENPHWRKWRQQALEALPLEAVYGKWLTGKKGSSGWWECRDPESPTGDQDPSAGVADGSGEAERGAFHSFITGRTISVFDFLVERGVASDFRGACQQVAAFSGVAVPGSDTPAKSSHVRSVQSSPLPQIRVNNRQLRDVIAEAWAALHAANTPPTLFMRGGSLSQLVPTGNGPRLEAVSEAALHGRLARAANWVRMKGETVVNVSPPREVARDLLACPDGTLPELETVVYSPVFDPHGKLLSKPGYHPDARLWYHAVDEVGEGAPGAPTPEEVQAAKTLLLEELLGDFPFASLSDQAHALAALLLPFVRLMIADCTPPHLLEAPVPGAGKGLLADAVSLIALGRPCEPTTVTADEDELRKKITALLAKGQPIILLDNVRGGIESAQLASVFTTPTWSDRLLGQNRMVDLPNRALWLITANNPRLSLEIARRGLRIRLDPHTDRPWQRTGFRHPQLREWVKANRPALVRALLVLVQSWISAGQPRGAKTLGSFERWAAMMGGLLSHLGIPGFLSNAEELYETADIESNEWREFAAAWWEVHKEHWVSAKDLLQLALERELLGGIVGDGSPRSQQVCLGRGLTAQRDRQFGEWRLLMRRDAHAKSASYRLVLTPDTSAPSPVGVTEAMAPGPKGRRRLACAISDEEKHPQRLRLRPPLLPGTARDWSGRPMAPMTASRGSALSTPVRPSASQSGRGRPRPTFGGSASSASPATGLTVGLRIAGSSHGGPGSPEASQRRAGVSASLTRHLQEVGRASQFGDVRR